MVRVAGLPLDSALWRAIRGGPHRLASDVLADVFDVLAAANWQRGGDKHAAKPQPYPRPGDDRREADRAERIRAHGLRARQLQAERHLKVVAS